MGAVNSVFEVIASFFAGINGHNQRMEEEERAAQKDAEARERVCTISRPSVIVANAQNFESLKILKGNISTKRVVSILR